MASVSKLPSGKWRAQVCYKKDGQTKRKSFTARTRAEALELAYDFEKQKNKSTSDIYIKEAIQNYIDSSSSTLSPSTISEYRKTAKLRYDLVNDISLSDISSADMRVLVNEWSKQGLSPKTIRNCYNLIHASIKMYRPDLSFNVTMPQNRPSDYIIPSDADIKTLLEAAKDTPVEIPIMLAAFCSMRRGEIAALQREDIYDGMIHINKNKVKGENGYVIKTPKTPAGNRTVKPPERLLEKLLPLPPGDITPLTPHGIFKRFKKIRDKAGLPPFRFHALRHYFASSLHYAGVPDKYIMKMGGWESASVLQNIYQHTLKEQEEELSKMAADYFDRK